MHNKQVHFPTHLEINTERISSEMATLKQVAAKYDYDVAFSLNASLGIDHTVAFRICRNLARSWNVPWYIGMPCEHHLKTFVRLTRVRSLSCLAPDILRGS